MLLHFLVYLLFLLKTRTPESHKRCLCILLDCAMWNRAVSFTFYNIWQKTHIPCASQTSPEAIKCVGYEPHRVRSSNHKSRSTYKPVHFLCMIGADPMIGMYIKHVQDISVLHTWSIKGPSVFQKDIWSIFIAVKLWSTFYVQFPQSNKNKPNNFDLSLSEN